MIADPAGIIRGTTSGWSIGLRSRIWRDSPTTARRCRSPSSWVRFIERMARRIAVVFVVFAAALVGARAVAAPPGYFIDPSQASTPRPAWIADTTGDFAISIRRGFPDSAAERLLGIAEAAYPPRDLLIRIAVEKGYEMGSDTARAALWWCDGLGPSRVAYAVTAGALEHYTKLTELCRERKFREAGTRPLFWSELLYRATIALRDSFHLRETSYSNVYVAHLRLVWTYDDGTFRPLTEARRVVVLTPAGEVLAVEGDGEAEEKVSISTHRGIGRQERIWR